MNWSSEVNAYLTTAWLMDSKPWAWKSLFSTWMPDFQYRGVEGSKELMQENALLVFTHKKKMEWQNSLYKRKSASLDFKLGKASNFFH